MSRVLEAEDHFARPGGRLVIYCPPNTSSPPSLTVQQPLQTTELFTERSRQKHNRMAFICSKLEPCGLTLLRTGTSQRVRCPSL
jgi:hypothetical protein